MSCEGNRHKFIAHLIAAAGGPEAAGVTGERLERLFWASRRPASELSPAERLAAEAKTRKLFAAIQAAGFKPPTHAADGMPKADARPGYAALYDRLKALGLLGNSGPVLTQAQALIAQQQPEVDRYGPNGRDEDGYDRWGYDAEGFDRSGFDREGYDQQGLDAEGYNRQGFNAEGFDCLGYNAAGYNRKGLDRDGYDIQGFDPQSGLDREGYDAAGYNRTGYDRAGFDCQGRDQAGELAPFFTPDSEGFHADGLDAWGYDREGYDAAGYDRFGFDRQGCNRDGFDRNGWNRHGFDINGRDAEGYDNDGFQPDAQGTPRDRLGYDEEGFDPQGYSWTGYDRDGLDREGQPRRYRDKRGVLRPVKFNQSGWDKDGFDKWGYNKETGLTAPDDRGRQYNHYGWAYQESSGKCVDPQDANRWMEHTHTWEQFYAYQRDQHGRMKRRRGGGKVIHSAYRPAEKLVPETPVKPRETMTREAYERTITAWRRGNRPYEVCINPPAALDERWSRRGRATSDPKACSQGCLLRCPHCGQFTGTGLENGHLCPQFSKHEGDPVVVHASGVVVAKRNYGRVLDIRKTPHNPDYDSHYDTAGGYSDYGSGLDREGYDRLGYDARGFNRQGYTQDGFDIFGYDREGFDRHGYNNAGLNRRGERRPRTLQDVAGGLEPGQDLLGNDDLASLYGRIATGLVGEPRRVVLREGGGFATDMQGLIYADPYPLGRDVDPRHNLVVTRAGIYHELGHELFTRPELWARVKQIAGSDREEDGLGEAGRKLLPRFYNIVEDGRMEHQVADTYAGAAEVLAASCRLQPRWGERVGDDIPVSDQVFWALLYTSLPYYRVRSQVHDEMTPRARALFDELEPAVGRGVQGSPQEAFEAAVRVARRFEAEGLLELPPQDSSRPLEPPPGTRAAGSQGAGQGNGSGGQSDRKGGRSSGQGSGGSIGGARSGAGGQGQKTGQGSGSGGTNGQGAKGGKEQAKGSAGDRQSEGAPWDGSQPRETQVGSGSGEALQDVGAPFDRASTSSTEPLRTGDFDDSDFDAILDAVEREAAAAVEAGVRRRSKPALIGKPLLQPIGGNTGQVSQRYRGVDGLPRNASINQPRSQDPQLVGKLEKRRPEHKRVASAMARQLKAIREQTEKRLRRQTEGRLDRRQLVNAYKGMDDVRTRQQPMPRTSFSASVAVDLSGSMSSHVKSGALYDAALTLGDTFDLLDVPYEVRGFGTRSEQYKGMGDAIFAPDRAACLAERTLGGTRLEDTTGLATSALLAREESNRIFVSLTDGELGDHHETRALLQEARRNGVVTFGIFLGGGADTQHMDELYGKGNWTTIQSLADMPKAVGQRLASIFKRMR